MKKSLVIAGVLLASAASAQDKPVLTVYTYDGFDAEWGPGPIIEKGFEATCGCDLQFVSAGDGAAVLSKVMLEGKDSKADVVVGLDNSLLDKAQASGLFAPHAPIAAQYDLPVTWNDPVFVPYDWGYFAFVYDKTKVKDVPSDFASLAASDLKVVIEDPRSSTPGLGLVMWVKAAYGEGAADLWKGLADNIVTVTPGWTEAYNLFLSGEADMVLSYTTSPAYHIFAEKDDTKTAAPFKEGHYVQVEVAAKLAASRQPLLADQFLNYLTGLDAQGALPETNWMYPAVKPAAGLPSEFQSLIQPEKALILTTDQVKDMRDKAVEEWRTALSQ